MTKTIISALLGISIILVGCDSTSTISTKEINTTVAPQFDTIEEYLTFSLEDDSANRIKSSSQPQGFTKIQINNDDLSIAPKGVDFFNAFVWAEPEWDKEDLKDIQMFYIETIKFDFSKEEETGNIMDTAYSTWYGPFQGKLRQLVE